MGCSPHGKCGSDIFCGAMPEFKITKKTKGDCIWGKNSRGNPASSMSAKGSIAEKYVNTGKCEYSVYGNPCFWKETMAYCNKLIAEKTPMNCPWYCNKEELYCAARYTRGWVDELGKGKCADELDKRYDAHCNPENWDFRANQKKLKHCRAHAFSRSCNNYYDQAPKKYLAKGDGNHDK